MASTRENPESDGDLDMEAWGNLGSQASAEDFVTTDDKWRLATQGLLKNLWKKQS